MSVEVMELFDIFAGTFGKEKAQIIVRDIESIADFKKQELATKGDFREVELRLTKEIESVKLEVEKVKSSLIKWVVSLLVAQTGAIIAILTLLK